MTLTQEKFYKEITPNGYGIAIKQGKMLFSEQSEFQKLKFLKLILHWAEYLHLMI